jgi:hypothetical protein
MEPKTCRQRSAKITTWQGLLHFVVIAGRNLDCDADRQTPSFNCLRQPFLPLFQQMDDAVNVCTIWSSCSVRVMALA